MCKFNMVGKMFFNTKVILKSLMVAVLITGFQSTSVTARGLDDIENIPFLKITLNTETLEGYILYDMCGWDKSSKTAHCKEEHLLITPQTKAYANSKKVPLSLAKSRLGHSASIMYYPNSLIVDSISWYF